VKSRNSSQRSETFLVMTVRPGKKFGFQSAAENLQRRRWPDWLRQTVPDRCFQLFNNALSVLLLLFCYVFNMFIWFDSM